MRFRRKPLQVTLALLQILPLVRSATPLEPAKELLKRKTGQHVEELPNVAISTTTRLLIKPTQPARTEIKVAPVDGKDGRPHEGPFVETAAERGRKQAKDNGDDDRETSTPSKKPAPKDMNKGASQIDGWDSHMPESNDGVMDDPHRTGPKEGTRGTEGGISEKNRDNKAQEGQSGAQSEKKPDSPKEAPPLPHSEQEKLASADRKEPKKSDKEGSPPSDERTKELGGLEVCFPCLSSYHKVLLTTLALRNRRVYPKSLTIFHTLSHQVHRKMTVFKSPSQRLRRTKSLYPNLQPSLNLFIHTFSHSR